jgi:large subunit ribosomal protein L15
MKTHKRRKSSREKGSKTVFWGARKKHKKSGHRGGYGMAGSGKRADQKKTLVLKLYGNKYFGKQGITSKGTQKDKRKRINIMQIESNLPSMLKEGVAKENKGIYEIQLPEYKILGEGEINKKMIIHAQGASASAMQKVKATGGEIRLKQKEEH